MHDRFLQLLPRIETHGRIFFRHIKCRQSREEAIAEMVALAWQWFKRMFQRGKDPGEFVHNITKCLVRAVSARVAANAWPGSVPRPRRTTSGVCFAHAFKRSSSSRRRTGRPMVGRA